MDAQDRTPDGDFFTVIPLEATDCAASVEVVVGLVQLGLLAPAVALTVTLTCSEARQVALAMVDASQQITEEEEE